MSQNKKTISDILGYIVAILFVIAILASPFLAIYDVLQHNRIQNGITKDMSDISTFAQAVHTGYLIVGILLIFMLGFIVFEARKDVKKKQEKWGLLGLSCGFIVYILPMFWLMYKVPGYWKVAIYTLIDIISE